MAIFRLIKYPKMSTFFISISLYKKYEEHSSNSRTKVISSEEIHIIARVLGKQDLPRYRKQNSCSMEKENILIDIGQDDALPNDNEVSCERSSEPGLAEGVLPLLVDGQSGGEGREEDDALRIIHCALFCQPTLCVWC
uniref:Uncharacterized protein n=1 Tax=Vespula pensylvanica TaxID=30213 RepID=A0A834UCY8_VESPE|nr:hypothetical protein H0235_004884 [Vespula pensylvanica]